MASVIKAVSFDAADALALATFWAAALGSDVDEELGATVVRRHEGHTVMQDPEGNEFCVEPGPAALPCG